MKIYNEKLNWNTESRIKSIMYSSRSESLPPMNNHVYHVPNYKLNWKSEAKVESRNKNYKKEDDTKFYKV